MPTIMPKKTLILVGVLVSIVVILLIVTLLQISSKPRPEKFTSTSQPLSIPSNQLTARPIKIPLQRTEIGQTTDQEIKNNNPIQETNFLPDNQIEYQIISLLALRPNLIITKDNKVIFERIIQPTRSSDDGFIRLSQLTPLLGEPDKVIKGTNFYGETSSMMIYPQQGITLVGNEYTGSVYEIQRFLPTTSDDYLNKYGGKLISADQRGEPF